MQNLPREWNLKKLYQSFDSKEFQEDFGALKALIAEANDWAEANFKSPENPKEKLETFFGFLSRYDKYSNLFSFAHLSLTTNSSNTEAKKAVSSIQRVFSDRSKSEVLFNKFVGQIENLDAVIASSELLSEFAFALNEIKDYNKHLLSEKEEFVLTKMTLTGSNAWGRMKEELYSKLSAELIINGETKTLPMTSVRNLAHDANAETRKAAYDAELAAYAKIEIPVACSLNSIKGEVIEKAKLRGYESVIDMTLDSSRLDRQTFDAMISAMVDYLPVFRKYFRKKAEMLGHKNGLPFYDIFAPVGKVGMTYSYEEAAEFVVKNFSSFSKKMGDFARNAFENAWIDVDPKPGKQGGAFCSNVYGIGESRILTNFSGSFSNMTTLAHELGHGYHGLCMQEQRLLNRHYPMPIAETASIFCETIVCEAAQQTASKDEAFVILENDLMGTAQVIVDIYSRYLFEDEIIRRRAEAELSVDEIKEAMRNAQLQSYGDGLDPNFLHPYMWINKPHYYYAGRNYYNFPYAFGQLFSKGLYAEFLKQGEAFVEKYDKLLSATGRNNIYEIGKLAGVDVHDKAFWAASLELSAKDVERFCNWS